MMIEIIVKIIPPLVTGRKEREIAKAIIINDGTGTKKRGNYQFALWLKRRDGSWRSGTVRNFPRKSYNVWKLIKRMLNEI